MSCSFLNGSRLSVCENGRIYWDNQTNQAFTLVGYSPITADNFYNIGGPGTCFPKVKLWLDAARGVHSFEGGRTSIWYDLVNGNTGHGLRASTTQSGMWPVATMASGFPALRFGEFNNGVSNQKKGLPIHSEGGTPFSLWETPYTIFAVVQRDSGRGENYFLKTDGLNCGLLGCEENSALHLGWRGDRTIRFGQYGNDVDIQDVPPFDGDNPAIVLVTAQSDEQRNLPAIQVIFSSGRIL